MRRGRSRRKQVWPCRSGTQVKRAPAPAAACDGAYDREVKNYNQVVRRDNDTVKRHRARLQQELNRRAATTRSTVAVRASVGTVVGQFHVLDCSVDAGLIDGRWLDPSEREATNSAAVLNALLAEKRAQPPTASSRNSAARESTMNSRPLGSRT